MADEAQREALEILREIRDRQREAVEILKAQRALVEDQLQRSRDSVSESIGLQKTALRRQRQVTMIAIPGILACILAIAYLVVRYF
jgi:type VI protein secretion system component VasF